MDNPYPIKTVFTIPEAAAAILTIAYPVKTDWVKMKPIADELKLAIQSGELKADTPIVRRSRGTRRLDGTRFEPYPSWDSSKIARADLLTWCEQRGIRPPLLFPEQPAAKPLHANERSTLLAIIRALAELNGIKPGSGAYRKEAIALLAELGSKGIDHPCDDKTLSKHLRNAFKSR